MTQQPMFPAKFNSPITTLAIAIDDTVTTISVVDATKLPPAPNLATIGVGESAETIKYEGISGNDLTNVTRGFQGTASSWGVGITVSRMFTAYDYDALRENHEDHIISDAPHIFGNVYKLQYNSETGALEIWKMT